MGKSFLRVYDDDGGDGWIDKWMEMVMMLQPWLMMMVIMTINYLPYIVDVIFFLFKITFLECRPLLVAI